MKSKVKDGRLFIPHSRPTIDKEDINAVTEALASGQLAQGEKVREFEENLARYIGVKYCAVTSSGTSALYLTLKSLNIGEGDEVIIPSYVCSSPYMATLQTGAKPKIVDVETSDFNVSAATIKKEITPKTKAVVVPHMFGTPAEIEEILDLGVTVIEDCAHSIGAEYKGKKVGSLGEASICSFYATKMMTTGEGGAILTNNRELYGKIVETREYDKKPLNTIRYNYKMTDFQAALGLSQLKKLNDFIRRRREIAEIYDEMFSKHNVITPSIPPHKKPVYYRYVIMVNKLKEIQKEAREKGVICEKPVWKPLHQSLPNVNCPNSDYIHNHALSIPVYPNLTEKEIEYVTEVLEKIIAKTLD